MRYFAQKIGMEYAEVTCASLTQNQLTISLINLLVEYAEEGNGMLIFIDEGDGVVLQHVLNLMGQPSNKIMIICATNRPIVFDKGLQEDLLT